MRLLRDDLATLCTRHHPETLFVGSDICFGDGARGFLRYQLNRSGYAASAALRELLATRHAPYVHNVGIVGGRFRVLQRIRRQMVEATRLHYARHPGRASYVIDSVVLNDLLLQGLHEGPIEGGFPRGVVNMPMAGDACVRPKFNGYCLAAQFRGCSVKNLLASMSPNYYFAHKLGCGGLLPCR